MTVLAACLACGHLSQHHRRMNHLEASERLLHISFRFCEEQGCFCPETEKELAVARAEITRLTATLADIDDADTARYATIGRDLERLVTANVCAVQVWMIPDEREDMEDLWIVKSLTEDHFARSLVNAMEIAASKLAAEGGRR